ncbi:MAG: lysine transporter LysE, partial [Tissierellia bacterium]|nr:lysine transporter LysE [Tissierellia bacterium]
MFSWTELIVFALIATWTPGPNPITSMGNASAFGFKETVPFWMGIYPAFFILMLLAAFLSKGLMEIVPSLQKIMVFLGALYIFYLAYKML